MRNFLPELIREFRWLVHSRTALALAFAAVVMAIWGAVSGATTSVSAIAAFQATLARYRANGEDITGALNSPASVEGSADQQVISNPLRYDLDQAALALTQLDPLGAISSTLSLCALFMFPIIGFVLGIFVSTHDYKSGSLAFRWPRSGAVAFAASKPVALLLAMGALAVLTAALAVPAAWIARLTLAEASNEIAAFAVAGPSAAHAFAIGALSVLTGTAGAATGLLIGALTRNRTFTVAAFSVGFLLIPLLGIADPRNLITVAGRDLLYFVGQFRPRPLGDFDPLAAAVVLAAIAVVSVGLSVIPWLARSRTERRS